jgi:hypothetical protein
VENYMSHLCLACQREAPKPLRLWLSIFPGGFVVDAAFCGLSCLQAWLGRQLSRGEARHV